MPEMMAPLPAPDPQQAQQPSMVDAAAPGAKPSAQPSPASAVPKTEPKKPEYTDANIKMWENLMARPLAKKYGMDVVFQQRIADRRSKMEGYYQGVTKGYSLKEIPKEDRGFVQGMMKERGLDPDMQRLKPEYVAGLRVLHVSLIGDPNQKTKGLYDYLYVLDNPNSRMKIAMAPELLNPPEKPGMVGNLFAMAKSTMLNDDEKHFIRQMARSISAINSLRTVTGLPRATQQLMQRYVAELPNVIMDSSAEQGYERLALIHREITAALKQGGTEDISHMPPPPGGDQGAPPPPEGFKPDQ